MNTNEFNRRTQKAQLSRGWSHDRRHYQFDRYHPSQAPFTESRKATRFADVVIGVVSIVGVIVIVVLGVI